MLAEFNPLAITVGAETVGIRIPVLCRRRVILGFFSLLGAGSQRSSSVEASRDYDSSPHANNLHAGFRRDNLAGSGIASDVLTGETPVGTGKAWFLKRV